MGRLLVLLLNIFGEIFTATSGGPANYTTTLRFNISLDANELFIPFIAGWLSQRQIVRGLTAGAIT